MTPQEIKELRLQSGYTLGEFSKMLGLRGTRSLRHWEAGTRPITEPMQRLIRELLSKGRKSCKD